jgi:hypothetical protein
MTYLAPLATPDSVYVHILRSLWLGEICAFDSPLFAMLWLASAGQMRWVLV